ncbi:hypothetical protein F5X68DRAFT_269203 [Plectosphaerella plurivora]|uniref:Extracellular serine-rich protein n=1 Tax=Plectosphaerella plurivora TaxID=936078 RepID=A0A9P8VBM0_9PEZI|nr:hypothetical protein F5X68DRAFT_269203 [Plectosphaerella plurivora]
MRSHFSYALLAVAGVAAQTPVTVYITVTPDCSAPATSSAPAAVSLDSQPTPSLSSIDNKILILARDADGVKAAGLGLSAYGIPYEGLIIPKEGTALPVLNSSATVGKYSGIIVMDALAYDAVTTDQWTALAVYQVAFKIRMVRINEFPSPAFGTTLSGAGGFTNTTGFPTANLKADQGITTAGLWHYPAKITDSTTTWEVASFSAGGGYEKSSAAVINNFGGREQWVWFTSWAPNWSATSNYLQHAHIHWMTRGVFLGKRKVHLSAQVDDVQMSTEIFKTSAADMEGHGSSFMLELAHNGNGNLAAATAANRDDAVCNPNWHIMADWPPTTELEFQKPLGTGVDLWPADASETYGWTAQCAERDTFVQWFKTSANRDSFAHLSHTFTHLYLNNATFHDTDREIKYNQDWMKQMGIDQAAHFSPKGLVPPAITGMHNGDAIRAWMQNGLTSVTGDNTRPVLRSTESPYWPLISTVEANGYDNLVIVPRYSTNVYYNCDTPECNLEEWKVTSAGVGDYTDMLKQSKQTNTRYLFSLQADPYMFHQANMRVDDMPSMTIGSGDGSYTGKVSLIMAWTETVAQEVTRLTNWPITSMKHDDLAQYFVDRMTLDKCAPSLSYGFSSDGNSITSVTVSSAGPEGANKCSVKVPVTIPSGTVSGATVTADKVGSEPPIQWVTLNGAPVTLKLSTAVQI